MLKPFSGEKNSNSRRNGAQIWRFLGKMGVETLDFGFAASQKALPYAELRRLTYFASKSVHASRLYTFSRTKKKIAASL